MPVVVAVMLWLLLTVPARADPASDNYVSLREYLLGVIQSVRDESQTSDKRQVERINSQREALDRVIADYVVADRQLAAEIKSVGDRVSLIDGINAKVEALTTTVDHNNNRLTQIESGGSLAAQTALVAIADLKARLGAIEGANAGVNTAWNVGIAILGLLVGGAGVAWSSHRSSPAKRV